MLSFVSDTLPLVNVIVSLGVVVDVRHTVVQSRGTGRGPSGVDLESGARAGAAQVSTLMTTAGG